MIGPITRLSGTPGCSVAESPIYDPETGALYWVDIIGKQVFRYAIADEQLTTWQTEDFPTAIALSSRPGRAVLAFAGGVADFDLESGEADMRCVPDATDGNRLNEGKCDPQGRFWVGSMQTNLNPDGSGREMDRHSGALFRIDSDFASSRHSKHEFGISNTLAWSPDSRTLYCGDTLRNVIFAYDFDPENGEVGNRRVLCEGYKRGLPDGSAIDADGCLWNARFGGGVVIRITPNGCVDQEIEVPATNPTSCSFAGPDLRTLIITSASFTLSEDQLKANAFEGAVLRCEVGVSGITDNKFQQLT
ncbi:MAG: SMP-30/gluconolactonase/LRE family protein [Phyllobacteriaceae bacterium]|jgi:sugar lactone lactonase YvrE|nr:SMP-30/gluconolactonase/LRE family protein [Phyllobacteriaceae bacterium]